jgi:hypothetical protein
VSGKYREFICCVHQERLLRAQSERVLVGTNIQSAQQTCFAKSNRTERRGNMLVMLVNPQAALLLVDELMALGAEDVELAQLLFPMLMVRELRDAAPPVNATAALVVGHFGASCAQAGNK